MWTSHLEKKPKWFNQLWFPLSLAPLAVELYYFYNCILFRKCSLRNWLYAVREVHLYSKNGFFGPKNSVVPLEHKEKTSFFNFEPYDLANGMK
jgi:hypothetical protein